MSNEISHTDAYGNIKGRVGGDDNGGPVSATNSDRMFPGILSRTVFFAQGVIGELRIEF